MLNQPTNGQMIYYIEIQSEWNNAARQRQDKYVDMDRNGSATYLLVNSHD